MQLSEPSTGNLGVPSNPGNPSTVPASAPSTIPNATPTKKEDNYISYQAKSGDIFVYDCGSTVFERYGFMSGARVHTPKGSATVIGLYDNFLWFHIDGDRGASYWDNCKSYEDLLQLGISILDTSELEFEPKQGEYRVKRVDYKGKPVNIILQNENGPCPLIAIGNILALRGNITLDGGKNGRISVSDISQKIANYLKQIFIPKTEEEQKALESLIKSLPDLQVGLDVNCGFTANDSFESSSKTQLFTLLNIRMLHGWLIDPKEPVASVVGNDTYNDLMLKLVTLDAENNTADNKEEKKEEKKYTKEEGTLVQDFLSFAAAQLTEYGLRKLHETINEDELVVFFRNNHFTALTKHSGALYNLVTDIGYERERNVVWDLLASVDGDSSFFSGDFNNTDRVKIDEVMSTAVCIGFQKEHAEEAIKALTKPNEELKVDEVLNWLQMRYPIAQ